jgi:hypothetical protein
MTLIAPPACESCPGGQLALSEGRRRENWITPFLVGALAEREIGPMLLGELA